MILVSDQAISSKWWWIGAIRNTRRRKRWNAITWITTESASMTKMPPIRISSTSVCVITASAAIAPPSPSEPVSPMNTDAGNELNQRKTTQPPTRHADSSARSRWISPPVLNVIAVKVRNTIAAQPAASPSRPSVRFTPLVAPASTRAHPAAPWGRFPAVGAPRQHQEDQDRVAEPEVDVGIDHLQVERVRV